MLFHAMAPSGVAATAKVSRRDAGNGATYAWIRERQVCIGKIWLASAYCQRCNKFATATVHVHHINVRDVHYVHAVEAASVPGIESIMRPHRKPADGSKPKA